MKLMGMFKAGMLCLACLGMILPVSVVEAAVAQSAPARPHAGQPSIAGDVELAARGTLPGQVVDPEGRPVKQLPVALRLWGREVASAKTDQAGRFIIGGLRGGTYHVVAGGTRGLYRIWAPKTAPPAANRELMIVVGGPRVRGNEGPIGYWLGNPWVVAGVVAAAVLIPVVIHQNRVRCTASP